MKIFVINPGSTSTKFALYDGDRELWKHTTLHPVDELAHFLHPNEQFEYRRKAMYDAIREAQIPPEFDAVIGRGGLLKPTPGGVYEVDELIRRDLVNAEMEHVCNLGGLLAEDLASQCGSRAFIADPEVVDEFMPEARLSGLPELPRHSIFHALNSKAASRQYAASIGRRYEDLDLIVVHMGGGISVGAHRHGRVIDVNNALNGDGPFSPERAGTLPADQFAELCFSGKYTLREIKKMINGRGGLAAHLGLNDVRQIAERAEAGEEPYRSVLDAMIYSVAREVGARYVSLRGHVDAIIVTGGIAYSRYCVDRLKEWIDYLAPIVVRPGEDEVQSLAYNAMCALTGQLPIQKYKG
ncbi:MAG: butyrate kinase [Clostridium sp.]|nr:butyrate kinase [Clostridium sp.]